MVSNFELVRGWRIARACSGHSGYLSLGDYWVEDLSIASETRSKNLKNSRSQKESLSRTICLPVDSTVVCKKNGFPFVSSF